MLLVLCAGVEYMMDMVYLILQECIGCLDSRLDLHLHCERLILWSEVSSLQ
jgi:hypothetical protein